MGSPLPRIGVVVLNWNGRAYLQECLESLLASDHPSFCVVVVDNASCDGSLEYMRKAFPPGRDPRVHLVALAQNLRFAGGNNAGVQRALEEGAEVVLLLNNDTVVDPDALSHLGRAFAAEPGIGVAGPRICYHARPDTLWYGGGLLNRWWGLVRHRGLRRPVDAGFDPPGPTAWVTGCALAVRGDLWRRLGGLDESYYIYAEDVDLCLRAALDGAGIYYEPRARVLHHVSASVGGHTSPFKVYHKTRGTLRLMGRYARPWQWPTVGASLVAQSLLNAAWLTLRGVPAAGMAALVAWWDAAMGRNRYPVGEVLGAEPPGQQPGRAG